MDPTDPSYDAPDDVGDDTDADAPRRRRPLVLVVVALLAVGALGAAGWRLWLRADYTVDGPVVAHARDTGEGNEALVGGTLAVTADGCLRFGDSPIVWPHDTRWDAGDQAVVLADGRRVRDGDTVEGGGGFFGDGEVAEELGDCRSPGEQVVFFNSAEVLTLTPR